MRKRINLLVLPVLTFGAVGCSQVETREGHTILSFPLTTVIGLGLLGILTVALGIVLLIYVLPGRLLYHRTFGRKIAAAMRLGSPVIFGLILLSAVVPFWWYRVDIGPETLDISEFPDARTFRRQDVKSADVIPGGSAERIRIEVAGGKPYFVNESEIGGEAFKKVRQAFERFMGARPQ